MTTTVPDIIVTVDSETTTFAGLANVRRHDHPTPAEIAGYIRSVLGPAPGNAHVRVVAEAKDFSLISRALDGYDVELSHEPAPARSGSRHALRDAEPEDFFDEGPIEISRPEAEASGIFPLDGWQIVVIGIAAVLCIGAIWATVLALGSGGDEFTPPPPQPEPAPASETVGEASTSEQAPPPTTVISRQGLAVEVPAGFSVEADGDMWRATGRDPDFRLQLAVDPLYQLPPERLLEQIKAEIDADPAVELLNDDGTALTYREDNADGSHALWKTWAEADHQLSVGCHTRAEPTTVHSATCRMAMESATFRAEDAAG
ncbi:type VII secretion-associated protein [Corynebacterium lipophiloflavum]|uniref:Type VII secretion-associated protein, Rv3446c family n=1 Tax=Corynebacterium lipophiloflavum (strain ATCC 700352 / DSM 44291 / CCUG 37336 / JCM 10383 / DMMZ 1944) TaxID=525263 RepID=C0XUS3_CORLD|nr:type VII secretion-associated protein [Corynebacterium lipophiloflavum]EEI15989.1 type VII secretion-associated protein, Rv3446c family [Corynebacterium lipophiloflavum DSM 44291]